MFTSISQVNEEFFKQFHNLKIVRDGRLVTVPLRYAKKSAKDYVEADYESYPCIVIQDHPPTIKREWFVDVRNYVGGLSMDKLRTEITRNPIWFEIPYDVSTATTSYNENMALRDLFMRKFMTEISFLLNQKLTGEDAVGDVVPYEVMMNEIPRMDGVHETNYEFRLSAWIHLGEPKEVETITDIIVNLHQTDLK